jgi:hypothetical protein
MAKGQLGPEPGFMESAVLYMCSRVTFLFLLAYTVTRVTRILVDTADLVETYKATFGRNHPDRPASPRSSRPAKKVGARTDNGSIEPVLTRREFLALAGGMVGAIVVVGLERLIRGRKPPRT